MRLRKTGYQAARTSLITWIGHATFLFKHGSFTFLTDPHFSKRASPLQWIGPKRTTPPSTEIKELPHIDVVLISHDHYDHLDKHSVLELCEKQKDNPPLFVLPLGLGQWFMKKGIFSWVELDWWESYKFNGWTFTSTPAQHFSGRSLQQDKTLWCGWVAKYKDDKSFLFCW